jgi:hypothetical protein
LDRRVERFVQRYLDSTTKLEVLRTLAARPNRFYPLDDLAVLAESPPGEVEHAVHELDQLGIVTTKADRSNCTVGLSRAPVVRDTAVLLFRYSSQPGGHAALSSIARRKR